MTRISGLFSLALLAAVMAACSSAPKIPSWETDNPVVALPAVPLGLDWSFNDLPEADRPTPEKVRLGRWLFFDKRLSADGTVSCATCHQPDKAFSEQTPHSTGIRGQQGGRKAPSFVNQAWTLYPFFFWDGRAKSLEEQALGPIANPIEMGNTHDAMIATLNRIPAYGPYFQRAFGSPEITPPRVAKAIADYERTVMSGNAPWDRFKKNRDQTAISDEAKLGEQLFFGKASCNQCHLGQNLTDTSFHNIGVGWNEGTQTFADDGRAAVTKQPQDRGAFKTPGLRDITKHAPYMHDGSMRTLAEVVDHYDKGGTANPALDPKMKKLFLTAAEKAAVVRFLEALTGENPVYTAPASFPQ